MTWCTREPPDALEKGAGVPTAFLMHQKLNNAPGASGREGVKITHRNFKILWVILITLRS
jgi:hypothetical protein